MELHKIFLFITYLQEGVQTTFDTVISAAIHYKRESRGVLFYNKHCTLRLVDRTGLSWAHSVASPSSSET